MTGNGMLKVVAVAMVAISMTVVTASAAPLPHPRWLYEPEWNMACVIVRGARVDGGMGEVKAAIDGTVLKLR